MRTRRLLAAAAVCAVALAGCAIDVPEVEPRPAITEPSPALDAPRLDRVLEAVGAAIAEGDAAADAEALGPRVTSLAAQARAAEYRLAALTAELETPTTPPPLTTEAQVAVISESDTWPKTIIVYTSIPEGVNSPYMLALRQEDPRAEYQLLSWARMQPGVQSPDTALPSLGSPEIAPDSTELGIAPAEVAGAYADLLTNGGGSAYAETFAEDSVQPYVSQVREAQEALVEDAGEFAWTFAADDFEPVGLGTIDGGAIVFAAVTGEETYTRTVEDSTLTIGQDELLLLATGETGELEVEESFSVSYLFPLVFYIPPAGSEDQVQVLAAERVLLDATTE